MNAPSTSYRFRLSVWLAGNFWLMSFGMVYQAVSQDSGVGSSQTGRSLSGEEWRVELFTVVDGLPDSRVIAIEEDSTGFLWVGTWTGLTRYDGYSFSTFRPDVDDTTRIGGSNINMLQVDAFGDLWIGGHFQAWGLSRRDHRFERFHTYRHNGELHNSLMGDGILAISTTSREEAAVWISQQEGGSSTTSRVLGLSHLNQATGLFTHYPFDARNPGSLPHLAYGFLEDSSGTLWGAGWGLNRFDPPAESQPGSSGYTFTTFLPDSSANYSKTEYSNRLQVLYSAPSEPDVIWAGGPRGLHRFDISAASFTASYHYPLHSGAAQQGMIGVEVGVSAIHEDREGVLWVGTYDEGLFTFDRRTGRFNRFSELAITTIHAIKEDRFGILWIGSSEGLARLERRLNTFSIYKPDFENATRINPNAVAGIYEDRAGHLWFGNAGDLHRLTRRSGDVRHYSGLKSHHIYGDSAGILWIADCLDGLIRMNPAESESFVRYRPDPTDSTSIGGCANPPLEDRAGNLWVTNWGDGLSLLDRQTDTFTYFRNRPNDPNSLGNNYLLRAYEAPSEPGVLWLGSEEGLIRFEPETKSFTNLLSDAHRRSMMMLEDRKGQFWVATASNGLQRFNRDTGVIERTYTVDDGLAHNAVWSVYEDVQGFLWLSTSNGLSRFDPETESFSSYSMSDGLPHNQFIEGSHFQSASGELFYGSPDGLVSFFPDQVKKNTIPPKVMLTDFRVAGASLGIGPDGPLEVSIAYTKSITLSHEQNDLTLEFVGIHSVAPLRTRYRYQLVGSDTEWIEAGTDRRASYPRLAPGDYSFRVNAMSGDGVWNETGASIAITILPPWWRTWWAYTICGLIFIAGIVAVDRFQRRRLVARERLRAEREKARAIESTNNELQRALEHLTETQDQLVHSQKMASLGALTAGIAHELKNPLNFVNNFAELNEDLAREARDAVVNGEAVDTALLDTLLENASKIKHHGVRADGIIRAMLDHARTQPGSRAPVDLNGLLDEYVNLAYHGMRARLPEFNATIERRYDDRVGMVEMVPQEIGRVFLNLLDNAFYAVNERQASAGDGYAPTVWVETKRVEDQVEVRIKDNGPGIPRDVRDRVFEPFFTTKPAGSGTGLGLSLSYDIVVKGHGGELTVGGEHGTGASFVLRLPA